MNKPKCFIRSAFDWGKVRAKAGRWLLLVGCYGLLGQVNPAIHAQGTVKTLGGGPLAGRPAYGYQDGPTLQQSQFFNPYGLALDVSMDFLYVADRDNGRIRILDLAGDTTGTLLKDLKQPVAIVVDESNNLYIANQGDGTIIRYDTFGELLLVASHLVNPSALALDAASNLYVTELGPGNSPIPAGTVKRIALSSYSVDLVMAGLDRPGGIAVLQSGLLAVSETGRHLVKLIDPITGGVVLQIGSTNGPGYRDGLPNKAAFNQPHQIAKAPNGNLVLADRGNHRVRLISASGFVTTLYGIDPNNWGCPYPGWLDGDVRTAEAREPVGVTVSSDGTVYTTEVYYHIIREVTGASGTGPDGGGGGGGGTNTVAVAPVITPDSGYLPMGQAITIVNPNTNLFFSSAVYYTTDGSEPTTNSHRLFFTNNIGGFYWRESLRDLSYLRVKAFLGNGTVATASGKPAGVNQIGVHRDVIAGIGANAIIPVVVNLKENETIQSLQFRVEVTPKNAATPPILDAFLALNVDTNNFVPLVVSAKDDTTFVSYSYSFGKTRGLSIMFIGPFANYQADRFGAVAVLSVPIPPEAVEGNSYTIRVLEYSATSDADQTPVLLTNLPTRTITVINRSYLVGDSTPGTWYNAGDFGDGVLDNSDVNAVLSASLGLRLPYQLSDVKDTMDAFPEDTPPAAGGDGMIRFLDWQTILFRSMRIPGYAQNYRRSWAAGGIRISSEDTGSGSSSALLPAQDISSTTVGVWHRPAQLIARPVERVHPGEQVNVPVYLNVKPGFQIAGLQFRAWVDPSDGGSPPAVMLDFVPAFGVKSPSRKFAVPAGQMAVAWNVGDLNPVMKGSNLIGHLKLTLPASAIPGSQYCVQFAGADGAPDMKTQYDFETFPASVWVQTPAGSPQSPMSYEWITNFFGSANNPWAQAEADPDADGVSNQQEFLAGDSPVKLRLHPPLMDGSSSPAQIRLRWFAELGKRYILETTTDLRQGVWTSVGSNLLGTGGVLEVADDAPEGFNRFYRIRLQPASSSPMSNVIRYGSQNSLVNEMFWLEN